MYVHTYIYMHKAIYIYIYVYIYIEMSASMYINIYIYIFMYVYIYIYIYMYRASSRYFAKKVTTGETEGNALVVVVDDKQSRASLELHLQSPTSADPVPEPHLRIVES